MGQKTIGDQELALLEHVAGKASATVREVADGFGQARGLARSTVLTMMERLRRKGFLKRRRAGEVYQYYSPVSHGEILRGQVAKFVEGTLSGSVGPFVAYLAEAEDVSDEELGELHKLVARLQSRRKGD